MSLVKALLRDMATHSYQRLAGMRFNRSTQNAPPPPQVSKVALRRPINTLWNETRAFSTFPLSRHQILPLVSRHEVVERARRLPPPLTPTRDSTGSSGKSPPFPRNGRKQWNAVGNCYRSGYWGNPRNLGNRQWEEKLGILVTTTKSPPTRINIGENNYSPRAGEGGQ
jgi:hypothetical protein